MRPEFDKSVIVQNIEFELEAPRRLHYKDILCYHHDIFYNLCYLRGIYAGICTARIVISAGVEAVYCITEI